MKNEEVRARIIDLAVVPAVRTSNEEDALFAAEAVSCGGLPIVELTMTIPNTTELIAHLIKKHRTCWSAPERGWIWKLRTPVLLPEPNSFLVLARSGDSRIHPEIRSNRDAWGSDAK
jgi:hypothetical protein